MSVTLADAVAALQTIAPLHLAEEWDNVGLLIEPSEPRAVKRALLTIDLTDAVAAEAIAADAQLVVAYHPPIFEPLKRIGGKLAALLENRIAVYSPHTALDASPGGVSDWLAEGLGDVFATTPMPARVIGHGERCKLVVFVPASAADEVRDALATRIGAGRIGNYSHCSFNTTGTGTFLGDDSTHPAVGKAGQLEHVDEVRLEMVCDRAHYPQIKRVIDEVHPYEEPAWEMYPLTGDLMSDVGTAKVATLAAAVTLDTLIARIKSHLGLEHVRIASPHPMSHEVTNIAVCPGAGGSVFSGASGIDVYLTGEMRHHDVLAKIEQGSTVILTDHTHTERGYLPTLKRKLREQLGESVTIDVSKVDADPLRIV